MNTYFEEFKELTNYDMIDTYYDDIKDFKYFISNLQEDRVESQKYIVRANKEIERLNNIIENLDKMFEYYFLGNLKYDQDTVNTIYIKYVKLKELKGSDKDEENE